MDWSKYPNFSKQEFDCKHTGRNLMQPPFLALLQHLRDIYGKPIAISSGYRDPTHPVEARKQSPGTHTLGLAADIRCDGKAAWEILQIAMQLGFSGIGIQQKGSSRFIHLDMAGAPFPRPTVWSY